MELQLRAMDGIADCLRMEVRKINHTQMRAEETESMNGHKLHQS